MIMLNSQTSRGLQIIQYAISNTSPTACTCVCGSSFGLSRGVGRSYYNLYRPVGSGISCPFEFLHIISSSLAVFCFIYCMIYNTILYFDQDMIGRQSFFFALALLLSILTTLFLPSSLVYLISFLLFPCASVWENTRACVPISYSHTEWYLFFFPTVHLQVHNVYSERKTRNSCAPVNLCL